LRLRTIFLVVALGLVVAAEAQASSPFVKRARADAAKELSSAALPPRAAKAHHDPSSEPALDRSQVACAPKYVVQHHDFWRVAGDPSAAWNWMLKHPPKHTDSVGSSASVQGGKPLVWEIWFFLPAQRNVASREVTASLTYARGGGTAIRVNGIAVADSSPGVSPCFSASY
jgi:hypothetical protein